MTVWSDVLAFALKAGIIVLASGLVLLFVALAARKRAADPGRLRVTSLDDKLRELATSLARAALSSKQFREFAKAANKAARTRETIDRRVFVIDFGERADELSLASLREEVSAIVALARPGDEAVVRVKGPGGFVHLWGLTASQMVRLRDAGLRVVACVDEMAASGAYMMACPAHEIVAAPFAIVGSIGVVAPVPNLNRWLETHGIDYEEMTAGKFKRTMSIFGKNTPEGRKKFQEQLDDTHVLFKELVLRYRPKVELETVATGEHWYGLRAVEVGLVDRLMTSDDYLLGLRGRARLFHLKYEAKSSVPSRLGKKLGVAIRDLMGRALATLDSDAR